ncbi:MAG: EAL domain-containing protein [Gammaproteobacteria bacterium]|nr:EAL domain-containing protein [Gammaproteobacteria bacterium]
MPSLQVIGLSNMINLFKQSTLASQLLIRVFSIYLLIAIAVTALHMFWQYHDTKKLINQELIDTHTRVAPGLTKALWDYNEEQIYKTIKDMELLPFINTVYLIDQNGRIYHSKVQSSLKLNPENLKSNSLITFSNSLIHTFSSAIGRSTHRQPQEVVGKLIIHGDNDDIYSRLQLGYWQLIVNALIKTLALWIIFLVVGYYMISKPLSSLTKATKKLDQDNLKPTNISIQSRKNNELKALEKFFNRMSLRLFHTRKKLTDQNALFSSVLNSTPDLIFYKDYLNKDGKYIGCNHAFTKFVGQEKENIIGHNDIELFGREVGSFFRKKDHKVLAENSTRVYKEWVDYPDGHKKLLSTSKTPFYTEDKQVLGVLGIAHDITQMHEDTKKIKNLQIFLQSTIDGINDPIMVIQEDYNVLFMNKAAKNCINNKTISDKEHPKCYEISGCQQTPSNEENHLCPLHKVINTHSSTSTMLKQSHKSGRLSYIELVASPLYAKDKSLIGVIEISRDLTKHLKMQSDLQEQKDILAHRAHYDSLTGLPNRDLFIDRLAQAIKIAQRTKNLIALLFIDLDHFKEINDSYGHHAGDEVLKEASKRLLKNIRTTDTVARLGGDEFTIILDNIIDTRIVMNIIQNLIDAMNKPINIDDHQLYSTLSIGVTIFPDDGLTAKTLLKNADVAMYKAKNEGRNTYRFYTEEMTEKAFERIVMETNLRQAIEDNNFIVYYQPQVDGTNNQLICMEALIRWQHETMGMVSPARFISLAEETGLIVKLDQWTMKTAMKQMVKWYADGLNPGVLALNLSIKQLQQKSFISMLAEMLKETNCKPEWIELEVTEGQIMTNPDEVIIILNQISDMGIELAVDDFGTGYSSLSYLKRLPIDKLKIDQSFVKNLPNDEDDAAITRSVIALTENLKLKVIAEGVETQAQKEFLVSNGCQNIQGYYYAKPMPADKMSVFLKQ